jgi:uncharacterized BrkB/YihY/UPF0761 family membrane protein
MPIDIGFRVIEADRRYAGGLIAGGMAFRIFVVLVPFAFVLVTVFAFLGDALDASDPQGIARSFGITGLVATAIDASADSSTTARVTTLVIGLYALLWSSWTFVLAVRTVHGLAWSLPRLPHLARPWRATLGVVGALLGVFLLNAAAVRLSVDIGPLAELAARILFLGVIIACWLGVSLLLPRAPATTWHDLVPGAVLVGVGAEVLQFLTVYFFSRYIASKTDTYGTIGASVAILLWAYLLGRVIVTGAFLNAARWYRIQEPADPPTG